jgi:hypothetical protein
MTYRRPTTSYHSTMAYVRSDQISARRNWAIDTERHAPASRDTLSETIVQLADTCSACANFRADISARSV